MKVKYIEKQKGGVGDTLADVNKAKKELGWMPMINIYKGLEKYIKCYKKNLSLKKKALPKKNYTLYVIGGIR